MAVWSFGLWLPCPHKTLRLQHTALGSLPVFSYSAWSVGSSHRSRLSPSSSLLPPPLPPLRYHLGLLEGSEALQTRKLISCCHFHKLQPNFLSQQVTHSSFFTVFQLSSRAKNAGACGSLPRASKYSRSTLNIC